jgi:hypothetical protein
MVILAHNLIGKCDQLITYVSWLLNHIKQNYTMTEKEALTMVYVLHKFCHYLLRKKIIFLCGLYDVVIFGSETSSFRLNSLMAASLLGV